MHKSILSPLISKLHLTFLVRVHHNVEVGKNDQLYSETCEHVCVHVSSFLMFHSFVLDMVCMLIFSHVLHLYLTQCVLQGLGVRLPAGLGYTLVLFLSAEPGVEGHGLILVLLVPLQQARQTPAQL